MNQESRFPPKASLLLGAWVADAASLGLHWIYDRNRIADIAGEFPEFQFPDPRNYQGVKSYFAHDHKISGDLSHYGEVMKIMAESIIDHDGFSRQSFEKSLHETLSPGGAYIGYADKAMKGFFANFSKNIDSSTNGNLPQNQNHPYFGIDDAQIMAISRIPPAVCRLSGCYDFIPQIESVVRCMNHSDTAVDYGIIVARALEEMLEGIEMHRAITTGIQAGGNGLQSCLMSIFDNSLHSIPQAADHFGTACDMRESIPLSFFILLKTGSFKDAIRQNILCGGDSCGRAILIGSFAGLKYGLEGDEGIPLEWITQINLSSELIHLIKKF